VELPEELVQDVDVHRAEDGEFEAMPAAAMSKRQEEIDAILSKAKTVIDFVGASPFVPSSILFSIGVLGESLDVAEDSIERPKLPR
jgi:hypothetical protein